MGDEHAPPTLGDPVRLMAMFADDPLPDRIPVFPLGGALLLPRSMLPLNIFEPRYLAMVRDAMAGPRLIGMVQPREIGFSLRCGSAAPTPADLFPIGGLGRIAQFEETGDGRFTIELAGITRFRIEAELDVGTPYRQMRVSYADFAADRRSSSAALPAAVRANLEASLRLYLEAQELSADWDAVASADDEALVTTLATACPFDAIEKQALLEAHDIFVRADMLSMLMACAPRNYDSPMTLH